MQKKKMTRSARPGKPAGGTMKARKPAAAAPASPAAPVAAGGSFDTLKENMKKMDKGSLFDALKRVKEMKSGEWKDPNAVRELTQNIAQDIGIKVDPRRMDAFMNAYKDVTKNAGDKGPNVSVEDIAKKYANVDDKTIKEIKKFVK
ncbi:MAG: hypothetical protein OWT28_11425 [Firmicutes bacterium]|nr:hypothetical protein [Bacillota bacterium]